MPLMHGSERRQLECVLLVTGPQAMDCKSCALQTGVPARTVRRWRQHYCIFGELPCETRKTRKRLGLRRNGRRTMTPQVIATLKSIVVNHRWQYLDELQDQLLRRTGVLVHPTTIFRALTRELRLTLKCAYAKASQRNELRRAQYQGMMDCITGDPWQFIFIDETAKDRNASRRRRYWQSVGKKNDVTELFYDRNRWLYTLIGAVDLDGFVPEACSLIRRKRNANDNDPEAGTVDGERFESYVEHTLVPQLDNYLAGGARSIVVMDNATTHISQRVFDLISAAGAQLRFLPEYSPDLNPIEFCFRQYKSHLKRHTTQFGMDYFAAHMAAMGAPKHENMCRYFRHAGILRGVPDKDATGAQLAEDKHAIGVVLLGAAVILLATVQA
mmetsp:Transcript_16445/g.35977  ORF Transcript_16445/g.35977 Transcript_16445/m.35977 type:complete len:385 (+) Transcript_16445:971-2125(+)